MPAEFWADCHLVSFGREQSSRAERVSQEELFLRQAKSSQVRTILQTECPNHSATKTYQESGGI